jgi:hypothetical protein
LQRIPDHRGYPITRRPLCGAAIANATIEWRNVDLDAILAAARRGEKVTCGPEDEPLPLDWAILQGRPDVARVLLDAGADPNARWSSRGDRFPLQDAIEWLPFEHARHRRELIGLLLRHGADPDARWCPFESRAGVPPYIPGCESATGVTPLMAAAAFDQADTTYLLLDAGANPALTDADGETALDYATGRAVFELLLAAQAPDPATRREKSLAFRGTGKERSWLPPPPPPPPPSPPR